MRIGPTTLVTNRHLVADETRVEIVRPDGVKVVGDIVPTAFYGDLILIEADLGPGAGIKLDDDNDGGPYQSVGVDAASHEAKVYPPGRKLTLGDGAFARLHHRAFSQPGNSGGALIDSEGELVAIIASGGQGLNEALPASLLAELRRLSDAAFKSVSQQRGVAYRVCEQILEETKLIRGVLPVELLSEMEEVCRETENRQMIDLAAQQAGKHGALELSAELFEIALQMDDGAINARMGYLTTLHLMARYGDEIPHIRALLMSIPEESSLHRFAIQAGKWGGDNDLAETGLKLVQRYTPHMAAAAIRFLDSDMPPPSRLPAPTR